jgi:hypothetical protein
MTNTEASELAIIDVIGADKWKRIAGSIADLLRDALPFPKHGRKKSQHDLIRDVFTQIWETRNVAGEYADPNKEDHAVLLEAVHFELRDK